jgi:hypothetical protein
MNAAHRLIDVLLPSGGTVVTLYEAYFDESGDLESGDRIFGISGYMFTAENAKALDEDWLKALKPHGLDFFHMVDCANGAGQFDRSLISKDDADKLERHLLGIIKKYVIRGFSVLVRRENYDDAAGDPYTHCAAIAAAWGEVFVESYKLPPGPVAYFFEKGHTAKKRAGRERKASAYFQLAQMVGEKSPVSFVDKRCFRPLQAADILAWQTTKWAKDGHFKRRPPRKDFLNLMEHQHATLVIDMQPPNYVIHEVLWPVSERKPQPITVIPNRR